MPKLESSKLVIGWREWLSLPDLGIKQVKAKIDTGARTSSLHAFDLSYRTSRGRHFVDFSVHPLQKNTSQVKRSSAEVIEQRLVKNSGGRVTMRPVIVTPIKMGQMAWDIELTLIARDAMGFRMLLGRLAIKNAFLVDPGRSFLIGANKGKKP